MYLDAHDKTHPKKSLYSNTATLVPLSSCFTRPLIAPPLNPAQHHQHPLLVDEHAAQYVPHLLAAALVCEPAFIHKQLAHYPGPISNNLLLSHLIPQRK